MSVYFAYSAGPEKVADFTNSFPTFAHTHNRLIAGNFLPECEKFFPPGLPLVAIRCIVYSQISQLWQGIRSVSVLLKSKGQLI
jgi:hypothetical protein